MFGLSVRRPIFRSPYHDTVPTGSFGFVKRFITPLDQVFQRNLFIVTALGDSKANGDREALAAAFEF